jgi:hypothetical protein
VWEEHFINYLKMEANELIVTERVKSKVHLITGLEGP